MGKGEFGTLPAELLSILNQVENFHASKSQKNTGTGSRREGEHFEKLLTDLWVQFTKHAQALGAQAKYVTADKPTGARVWASLQLEGRTLVVPAPRATKTKSCQRWLELKFSVPGLVADFPGEATAVAEFAPAHGPYAGDKYPAIYAGLSTNFDDTVVLVEDGVLKEKILLEYKTSKSSNNDKIDGNAHERLSFQIMQYLEVATRYTRCSLHVLSNGAFTRFRNKYHTNFHVQSQRLRCFSWFAMTFSCTKEEHTAFLLGLLNWIVSGKERQQ